MKQIVIIKESSTTLDIQKEYMVIKKEMYSDTVIAFRHIQRLYINKLIHVSIVDCLKLAAIFELYFINQHGDILGRIMTNEKV